MKNAILIAFVAAYTTTYAQLQIKVTIGTDFKPVFDVKQGANAITDTKNADFSASTNEIHIINNTTDNTISADFINWNNKTVFSLPASQIIAKASAGAVAVDNNFAIATSGAVNGVANAVFRKGLGIIIKQGATAIGRFEPAKFLVPLPSGDPLILIMLNTIDDAKIKVYQGGKEIGDKDPLDFSAGNGEIHIVNFTTDQSFRLDLSENNSPKFRMPSAQINKMATDNADPVDNIFKIAKDGNLTPVVAQGVMTPSIGIKVVSSKGDIATRTGPPLKPSTGTSTKKAAKTTKDNSLYNYVEKQIGLFGYQYRSGQNLIIDDYNVIHIYLDENGNPIKCYYPLTAKENSDKFQFHIITNDEIGFAIESDGEFNPIDISTEVDTKIGSTQSDKDAGQKKSYFEYTSPIFGPYTGTFPFTITKGDEIIVDRTIKLLKTSRVSVNTGISVTKLQNPSNIAKFVLPGGDTTLIADNPTTRGFLSLVLTFHPIARNLNIRPRNFKERIGISVGTNLNAKAFDNFFGGISIELANGLFLNGGVHYGQVTYVVQHPSFNFGSETFTGKLETRKMWNYAPYLSISIDAALFAKVFRNVLSEGAGQ